MTSARMENRVRLISPVIQIPGIGMLGWGFFSPTSTSVTSHYTYRHIANVHVDGSNPFTRFPTLETPLAISRRGFFNSQLTL